ncbi:SH3 domain-containing protein [Streptomyces sp. ADMS]|uniref:SH3 domain-containing protein n=1 Tax=Streptomyces sp. ADMS TaxID=3071415 RepID=UPI00296FCE5D|nr:SH3 domain-containing protein [Streptomyces sp. ADMS]MDW4906753.1 SH3 domain-containing protein [Streptomyces sp. ADMS]
MRSTRIAISAALLGALALPLASASAATAAPTSVATAVPASSCTSKPYLPWAVHGTNAVTIRKKATTKSTAVGILYKSHKFTVHKTTKGAKWVYITDKTTGVKGWVSGTYVYRDVRMCLD